MENAINAINDFSFWGLITYRALTGILNFLRRYLCSILQGNADHRESCLKVVVKTLVQTGTQCDRENVCF